MNFENTSARVLANILRVMRCAGRDMQIVPDIENLASSLDELGNDNNARTVAANDIVRGIQSWREPYISQECLSGSIGAFENSICDAAIRLVAANLDGNSTEASRATRDLYGAIALREGMARERDRLNMLEIANDNANIETDSAAVKKMPKKADGKAECLVYFISDGNGAIKIGKSTTPLKRLAALQTAHPRKLELIATMPGGAYMEGKLHEKFAKRRLNGEWFKDCAEIRGYLAANDNSATRANAA